MTTSPPSRLREIPYNYTSFTDREIVIRYLGEPIWQLIEELRESRRTGRSARMLFEVLGDLWVIDRNPYLQDDLLDNPQRRKALIGALWHRLDQFESRANGNAKALVLLSAARQAVERFAQELVAIEGLRARIRQSLAGLTQADNLDFGGLTRVAHATDATDWRVEFPLVVIMPDQAAEVAPLVAALIALELTIIPRGGGTGYTGSAVPMDRRAAVINTEKFTRLDAVVYRELPGVPGRHPTVRVGAGVVTRRVTELAETSGLIFAVDPTSQHASTIGGNIAMNAGGKKAVRWGTTLDNLVSWRLVTPQAEWLEVERLDHNLGKIHEQDRVRFRITRYDQANSRSLGEPRILECPGASFRTPGLGKDVTDKALHGLPGIQKEGCDGLVTEACFLLHRMPPHQRTLCLEFFGAEIGPAVAAIVAVKDFIEARPEVFLTGLEHLDERYVRAVGYSTKANRRERPKMLLLADLASDDEIAVQAAAEALVSLVQGYDGEGFIAVSPEARKSFWADRARTAAISAHTNAFKINEDVVIPL
ncbi:MAG: DUF3683 domain-containing protein, partial [Pseudomonadota bacterium]